MAITGKFYRNIKTGDLVHYKDDSLRKFELFEVVEYKNGKLVSATASKLKVDEEDEDAIVSVVTPISEETEETPSIPDSDNVPSEPETLTNLLSKKLSKKVRK